MKIYQGNSADEVWCQLASDLVIKPEFINMGRGGETREFLQCSLNIQIPQNRWIFSRSPAYNPAFGIVEFIWIFNGSNDGNFLKFWNPQLPSFSGREQILHGAYGNRLRNTFGIDQIERAFNTLNSNPESRQVVLQIWHPNLDLPNVEGVPISEDIPCNVTSMLSIRNNRLYWTQIMRSNDVMRGLPYNLIQFSLLHECFASWLDCEMGDYTHVANSMHLYTDCLNNFSINQSPHPSNSIDISSKLNLSFSETEALLSSIYDDLLLISSLNPKNLSKDMSQFLNEIFSPDSQKNCSKPRLFQDMLSVIGSDTARRLGNTTLSESFLSDCQNQSLKIAAQNWLTRNALKEAQK